MNKSVTVEEIMGLADKWAVGRNENGLIGIVESNHRQELEQTITTLIAERDQAVKDAEFKDKCLANLCEDFSTEMDCLEGCNSYGHEDLCPVTNPQVAWRELKRERDALKAEVEKLKAAILKAGDLLPGQSPCSFCPFCRKSVDHVRNIVSISMEPGHTPDCIVRELKPGI